MTCGLVIAAPSSGSGKTVLTLSLLRALKSSGIDISSAKVGPDYIDPAFHTIATGRASVNLDPWAMGADRLKSLAEEQTAEFLLIEAMMGLFDGAADGSGSAADLAKILNIPVVLVVDANKQSHSIAALIRGFRDHDPDVSIAGVILNKVGSPRHETMLRDALMQIGVRVLGAVHRSNDLQLPERHLGLVQAGEIQDIDTFIEKASNLVSEQVNLSELQTCFGECAPSQKTTSRLRPLGQRIAIAKDAAFSFLYPHMVTDWREQGAEISFFSPLLDEAPAGGCDAIFLPGGYPELHAETLANARHFKREVQDAVSSGCLIYGECGGYMVLGDALIESGGIGHDMLGLLDLETSFEERKLHLGYRKLKTQNFPLGDALMAHEFHYTMATKEQGVPLFEAADATDTKLASMGLRKGNVMGSYAHIIDRKADG